MTESIAGKALRITEIFLSIQGESTTQGLPTSFVRLTGCPLRCSYCDTEYAFTGGKAMSIDDILQQLARQGASHVTVTGGEPLAQARCPDLLTRLCDSGYQVSIETSGAYDISALDPRVVRVMDLKTPSSGEQQRNRYANIDALQPADQIKFVVGNQQDYQWSRDQIREHHLAKRCELLMLPVYQQLSPNQLAQWILEDLLPVRMQLQMHKAIWGDHPGH